MDVETLLEEWENDGTGLRPKRLQHVRPYVMEYTGMFVPHRVSDIENWQETMKRQVTRKLREAAGVYDDEDDEDPEDGERDEE